MIFNSYSFKVDDKLNRVYTLSNKKGNEVDILDYGARIISVRIKDNVGAVKEFVLGANCAEEYYQEKFAYHGATIGRYANRIGNAKFTLNGIEYLLDANQNGHCLHGGYSGFHNKIWNSQIRGESLLLSLISSDGEGGFPGELMVTVKYTFTDDNQLIIEYFAKSDKDTHCNFTNHTYFTLGEKDVREYYACINSNKIAKFDEDFVANGEYINIDDTAYSFIKEKTIGKDLGDSDYFIQKRSGYDTSFCINRNTDKEIERCAYVYDKTSGMKIECLSSMPILQFYAAKRSGIYGGNKKATEYRAFCLEPQFYPNAVNCSLSNSTLLKKGESFSATIIYGFSVKDYEC